MTSRPTKPTGPDLARAEWLRKVHQPTYCRRVKTLSRMAYLYLARSRATGPRVPAPPTRREVAALVHEALTPITFEERRRSRDRRGSRPADEPSRGASPDAAPTTSFLY